MGGPACDAANRPILWCYWQMIARPGKSPQDMGQSADAKIFRWRRRANQLFHSRHAVPPGALAIVANEGQGAVDVRQRLTSAAFAYGEIFWVRRRGAGVKLAEAKAEADDGGNKAGHQDEIV
jgi:hypothetical protein